MESGTQLGHYTISSLIGKGGMGEVYQAKDEKLGRQVAIKVLPEEFARDTDRVARFRREAQLLASLNHPNIAAIHGLEETDGRHFLVLELVEGPTLADRIKQGAIPVEESLKLALQIAEALEAAHEKGVIHRDLKPANIKVTSDGKVKVLDFGLAKAFEGEAADANLSNSPTLSMAATQAGIILGTAAYMSPEQARGREVDGRTDVWAFGCVLYEMLTGRPAFDGEDVSVILARVIEAEPDYSTLPSGLHWRCRELLGRCLEKEARDRYQGISDARVDVKKLLSRGDTESERQTVVKSSGGRLALALGFLLGLLVAGGVVWNQWTTSDAAPVIRLQHVLSEDEESLISGPTESALAISPDGLSVLYRATSSDQLHVKAIDEFVPRTIQLSGTEMARDPVYSPDGNWIAYWSATDRQLKRVAVAGGAPFSIADLPGDPFGISWGADDTIVLSDSDSTGFQLLSVSDGIQERLASRGSAPTFPELLPDGKTILFSPNSGGISVQSLESEEPLLLLATGERPKYLPTGHLVYVDGGNLVAVPFDPIRLEVTGTPVTMIENVRSDFQVSDNGTLAYVGEASASRVLAVVDLNGSVIRNLGVRPAPYYAPRVSPDGTRLAVQISSNQTEGSVWLYDLSGNSQMRRLTQDGTNIRVQWAPDGERVTFASTRDGPRSIYWQRADGTEIAERLTTAEEGSIHAPESWARNVGRLSFVRSVLGSPSSNVAGGELALWTFEPDSGEEPTLFYGVSGAQILSSSFSADGDWIAYVSTEVDGAQVWVQPYPATGVRYQITQDGALHPVWSASGNRLYYQTIDGRIASVSVDTDRGFEFGSERILTIGGFVNDGPNYRNWDLMPNGESVLMVVPANTAGLPDRINIVVNWFTELRERVPVN